MLTTLNKIVPAKNLKGVMTYLKPDIYQQLKDLADLEDRSVSKLVARIITDWVTRQQELKQDSE